MMRALALVLALLVPAPASATPLFATSNPLCHMDTSADTFYFSAVTGTPTVSTIGAEGSQRCTVLVNEDNHVREPLLTFQRVACTGGSNANGYCTVNSECPGGACTTTDTGMVVTEQDAGSSTQFTLKMTYGSIFTQGGSCVASATMDGTRCGQTCASNADCVLWGRTDAQCGKVCVGGTNNAAVCTVASECPNGGACTAACIKECDYSDITLPSSVCTPLIYAQSVPLNVNTRYALAALQSLDGNNVALNLYSGLAAGDVRAVVPNSGQTHFEAYCTTGKCTAGSNVNVTCSVNSQCPGSYCKSVGRGCSSNADCDNSGVCTSSVVSPNAVRFGNATESVQLRPAGTSTRWSTSFYSTMTAGLTFYVTQVNNSVTNLIAYLGDFRGDDSDVYPNAYIAAMLPDGAVATDTNWLNTGGEVECASGTNLWKCLNEPTLPDYDTSAIRNASATKPTVDISVANPTPAASAVPRALTISALANNRSAGGAPVVRLDVVDGTGTNTGKSTSLGSFSNDGAGNYHAMTRTFLTQKANAAPIDNASVNATTLLVNKLSGGNDEARITSVAAEVLYSLPDPPVPTKIPDANLDRRKRVGFSGDSTLVPPELMAEISALVIEPTDIVNAAAGGYALGDTRIDISVAGPNNDILEGAPNIAPNSHSTVYRGTTGDLDMLFIQYGPNNWVNGGFADPANVPARGGIARAGLCDDNDGPNMGAACSCDGDDYSYIRTRVGSATSACRMRGTNWGNVDVDSPTSLGTCVCVTNNDCRLTTGHAAGTCNAPDFFGLKRCTASGAGSTGTIVNADPPTAWALPFGCSNSPGCPGGKCFTLPNEAWFDRARKQIVASIEARPMPTTFATPTPPNVPTAPVATSTPRYPMVVWVASYSAHTQAGPTVYSNNAVDKAGANREHLVRWAKATGRNYVDLYSRFYRDCPGLGLATICGGTSTDCCLGDASGVHASALGRHIQAVAFADCINQTYGISDGICGGGGVCTRGRLNVGCSANADCDTYYCNPASGL